MTDSQEATDASKLDTNEGAISSLGERTKDSVTLMALEILADSDDLSVFEQDQHWVVGEIAWPLDMMENDSLIALVTTLFMNAEYYHVRTVQRIAAELLLLSLDGPPDPELSVAKAAHSIVATEPVQWLKTTPLFRKVSELLDNQKTIK